MIGGLEKKIKDYALKLIQDRLRVENNESKLARELGVGRGSVKRWINGSRDFKNLGQAIIVIEKLGGGIVSLLRDLGEDSLADVIEFSINHPDLFEKLHKICTTGGKRMEKLSIELDFLAGDDREE